MGVYMSKKRALRKILNDVRNYLEFEKNSGMHELYMKSAAGTAKQSKRTEKLGAARQRALSCTKCSLSESRHAVVYGSGSPDAKLVFIGEAPGHDEDMQGLPFVGRAGQLLTKIIESIGYKRKDVYICNILKCRPPNNRNPLPSEIFVCQDYLTEQLDVIQPKLICVLGKVAAQTLLKTTTPISLLRGKFYEYHGIALIPTFHPAYLLRNPKDKRLVWEDMKKIRRFLEKKKHA
jgi:DNA polymerase